MAKQARKSASKHNKSREVSTFVSQKAKIQRKRRADKFWAELADKLAKKPEKSKLQQNNAIEPDYERIGQICKLQADICQSKRKLDQISKKTEEPKCKQN